MKDGDLMEFKTQYSTHDRVFQDAGSRERVVYSSHVDDSGVVVLAPSGKENLYEYIQSFKDSTSIPLILARYAAGDASVLSRKQGSFGDFTNLPKTYAEMLNMMVQGRKFFDDLPVEVRAKFDHSFERFMASMDNMPDLLDKLGYETSFPREDIEDANPAGTAGNPDVSTEMA